jgi:hypothetical protein
MIYVGLDVHKRFSRMGTFDPATGDEVIHMAGETPALPRVLVTRRWNRTPTSSGVNS